MSAKWYIQRQSLICMFDFGFLDMQYKQTIQNEGHMLLDHLRLSINSIGIAIVSIPSCKLSILML